MLLVLIPIWLLFAGKSGCQSKQRISSIHEKYGAHPWTKPSLEQFDCMSIARTIQSYLTTPIKALLDLTHLTSTGDLNEIQFQICRLGKPSKDSSRVRRAV